MCNKIFKTVRSTSPSFCYWSKALRLIYMNDVIWILYIVHKRACLRREARDSHSWNRAEITALVRVQKLYSISFLCQRKSYPW